MRERLWMFWRKKKGCWMNVHNKLAQFSPKSIFLLYTLHALPFVFVVGWLLIIIVLSHLLGFTAIISFHWVQTICYHAVFSPFVCVFSTNTLSFSVFLSAVLFGCWCTCASVGRIIFFFIFSSNMIYMHGLCVRTQQSALFWPYMY